MTEGRKKTRFCIDCRWSSNRDSEKYMECTCIKNPLTTDVVTGKTKLEDDSCSTLRKEGNFISGLEGTCGNNGRYFEPINKRRRQ